jgi:hypothetical protein
VFLAGAPGALVPVKLLVNGTSIRHERVDIVTYYHIALSAHDVLLAEGLPCESFLATGVPHPDFASPQRESDACAPFSVAGLPLEAARRRVRSWTGVHTNSA